MKVQYLKTIVSSLLVIAGAFSCADTNGLSGEQRKDAKKDRPEGENTNINNDAAQPQVVTGAYLTCVADSSIPDTRSGETPYGCGVYDQKSHAKIDMANRSMQLATSDSAGQPTVSRSSDAAASSPYMRYLYASANTTQVKVSILGAGNVPLFSSTISPIVVNNLNDALDVKNKPAADVDAWCSVLAPIPDNFSSNQMMFSKLAACGPQYICNHKEYNAGVAGISCIIDIVGTIKAIFSGGSSATGACLDPRIPGNADYAPYCR